MFKGITRKIILSNLIGLTVFFVGLVAFKFSRDNLIELRLSSMIQHANMISAILSARPAGRYNETTETLYAGKNGFFLRPPLIPDNMQARLFNDKGKLIEDSYFHPPGKIIATPLSNIKDYENIWESTKTKIQLFTIDQFYNLGGKKIILFGDNSGRYIDDFVEAKSALIGNPKGVIRINKHGEMTLSVAVPVKRLSKVLGVLQISVSGQEIYDLLAKDRNNLIVLFCIAFMMSFVISLILSKDISEPMNELTSAARIFQETGFRTRLTAGNSIPNLSTRQDEIGTLSRTFLSMLDAIRERITDTENFAADVSHELKNPLTSLKSSLETLERITDPKKREKLVNIIHHDIKRIDRLIQDISTTSRLGGELQRAKIEKVSMKKLLSELVEFYNTTGLNNGIPLLLTCDNEGESYDIQAMGDKIGHVFRNLFDNALSLSPQESQIDISIKEQKKWVIIHVNDHGPGIPEEALDRIFERFYSHRPHDDYFGSHSGLGLSIVKQIVQTHGGHISASNIRDSNAQIIGASFEIKFPQSETST